MKKREYKDIVFEDCGWNKAQDLPVRARYVVPGAEWRYLSPEVRAALYVRIKAWLRKEVERLS